MSAVGLDIGNNRCIVAVAALQRGVDVMLNDESKLEPPAVVCFVDEQSIIRTAQADSTVMSTYHSISQIKRLIGRQFSDPELQKDVRSLPFSGNIIEGPNGYLLIKARKNEAMITTIPRLFGMKLSSLKEIAQKNLNAAVVDCCIGIPVYFTDLQRRAVLNAATFAGLHSLRLIHETTATALAYGIYKTDLPENDQLHVAFVDIGHSSMQVCIAGFKKGQLKVLAHSYDKSLGGKEFDEVLFLHFAAKIMDEYDIDVFQSYEPCWRLKVACEKLKKVLSVNPEGHLNIESLMNGVDVQCFIHSDEFEQLSLPILERMKGPLEKALAEAGLTVENVHMVEVVGSGSHVPAINRILTEFFKKEPRHTMNASESVAKGCALQCAILSPNFNIREFQVNECLPFSIFLSWKGSGSAAQLSTIVFPKGTPIPSSKAMTFYMSGTFSVDVQYGDASAVQTPAKISTFNIGPFQTMNGEKAKVKLRVGLDLNGIVSVDSATLYGEERVDIPVSKESTGENSMMLPVEAPADAAATPNSNTNNPVSNSTDKLLQEMGEDSTSLCDENEPILADSIDTSDAVEDEEDEVVEDLLADLGDLDKAISISHAVGDKSNDFPERESLATSSTPSSSDNHNILIGLVRQAQQLLNVQLEVLTTNEGLQVQFFEVLEQLDAADKPEALIGLVTLLREFFDSLIVSFPKARDAISSHQQLKDSQSMNENKLESYTNAQTILFASLTKGKRRFDQLSNEIEELEWQLTEKKGTKNDLAIALMKNDANLEKAVDKISDCLQVKGEIDSAMPASTKAAEDAERLHTKLRTQRFVLKRSFDKFHP